MSGCGFGTGSSTASSGCFGVSTTRPSCRSLILFPRTLDRLDLQRRQTRLLRDGPILIHDRGARRLVAIEATKQIGLHLAVGTLAAVFIDHVEKHVFAAGGWLFGHGSN